MNFKEIMEALYAGKKITISDWGSSSFIKLEQRLEQRLVDQDGDIFNPSISSLLSCEWKEYKEPTK